LEVSGFLLHSPVAVNYWCEITGSLLKNALYFCIFWFWFIFSHLHVILMYWCTWMKWLLCLTQSLMN